MIVILVFRDVDAVAPRSKSTLFDPTMIYDFLDRQAFVGIGPQQISKEALAERRDVFGDGVETKANLFKQSPNVRVVEWILAYEHRIQNDSEAPDIGRFSSIAFLRVENFGADVRQTSVLVGQMVAVVGKNVSLFQPLK